jgi:hypothetical protein
LWGIEREQGVLVVLKGGGTSDGEVRVRVGGKKLGLFHKISTHARLDIPTSPRMSAAAAPIMHSFVDMRGLMSTDQH